MNIISIFNKLKQEEKVTMLYNTVTYKSIVYNDDVEKLINKTLSQQLEYIEKTETDIVLQIITAELLSRGIIVPFNYANNEFNYLCLIKTLKLPDKGFFNCKTKNNDLISEEDNGIVFFGVPCDLGASKPGSRYGPLLLREKSYDINFRNSKECYILDLVSGGNALDTKLYDIGNIVMKNANIDIWREKITKTICDLPKNTIPFMIGGDHSFTLSAVKALYDKGKDFVFIQLDQHLDIQIWGNFLDNKPEDLDQVSHANFVSWIKHLFPEIEIMQIGISSYQSITYPEQHNQVMCYLNSIGKRISDMEIISSTIDKVFSKIPTNKDVYLSIDVDVINSVFMDNTGFPAHVGVSLDNVFKLVEYIASKNKLIGVDMMEYGTSSKLETHNSTSTFLVSMILRIINFIK